MKGTGMRRLEKKGRWVGARASIVRVASQRVSARVLVEEVVDRAEELGREEGEH